MSGQHLIDQAHHELLEKSRRVIEEETAFKWAARAVAAYRLGVDLRLSIRDRDLMTRDAFDYYHEAIEHAALADDSGEVLRVVRAMDSSNGPRQRVVAVLKKRNWRRSVKRSESNNQTDEIKGSSTRDRRPYSPPVLQFIGTVGQLTRGAAGSAADGMSGTTGHHHGR